MSSSGQGAMPVSEAMATNHTENSLSANAAANPGMTVNTASVSTNNTETQQTATENKDTSNNSTASAGSDKGNNSDGNISLGNDPFGFHFDEGDKQQLKQQQQQQQQQQDGKEVAVMAQTPQSGTASSMPLVGTVSVGVQNVQPQHQHIVTAADGGGNPNALNNGNKLQASEQQDAAAAAVANLHSIANESIAAKEASSTSTTNVEQQLKRKADHLDNPNTAATVGQFKKPAFNTTNSNVTVVSSGDTVNTTVTAASPLPGSVAVVGGGVAGQLPMIKSEQAVSVTTTSNAVPIPTESSSLSSSVAAHAPNTKKKMTDSKREERNAREKERSFRIAKQINELRDLLSTGGVIVPKGTKSSVLTEAANYIRMLQQHQYKSEIDRHQLIQQMQVIGQGALGPQAANAIRHVATQNGVFSLGNFGGVPPRSAMSLPQDQSGNPAGGDISTMNNQGQGQTSQSQQPQTAQNQAMDSPMLTKIEEHDYRLIFNSSLVAMGIASMGGAFIDCNQLFTQISEYTKQEICGMTIFNLTSRADLQHAFDLVSQMISPPLDDSAATPRCVLRGSMKSRTDIGLSITLIKGDDGIAKCFCVTLIQNPMSPYDTSKPVPATVNVLPMNSDQMKQEQQAQQPMDGTNPAKTDNNGMGTPAFMTG